MKLQESYEDRMYRTYDLEDFFGELVAEGRPAPDPDALAKLVAGFSALRSGQEGYKLMSPKEFSELFSRC